VPGRGKSPGRSGGRDSGGPVFGERITGWAMRGADGFGTVPTAGTPAARGWRSRDGRRAQSFPWFGTGSTDIGAAETNSKAALRWRGEARVFFWGRDHSETRWTASRTVRGIWGEFRAAVGLHRGQSREETIGGAGWQASSIAEGDLPANHGESGGERLWPTKQADP